MPENLRWGHPDDLDAETNLYNSAFFSRYLEHITTCDHKDYQEFSLLLLDIDGLNSALASVGVEGRLRLLRRLAEKIELICAYEHLGFRVTDGGFAVVLLGIGKEGAVRGGGYVKSQIENATWAEGTAEPIHLSVKIGVAAYPTDGTDEASLLCSAKEVVV